MAKYHGRNVRVYLDGYDISGFANTLSIEFASDIVDVAGFGDSKKNYVVGLADTQVSHDGFFEDTPASGGHAVLSARLGSATNFMAAIGTQQGAFGFAGSAELEQMYDITSAIADAVKYKSKLINYGTQGIDLINLVQSRTFAAGTSAAWDSGTATSNGGRAYLQNFGSVGASTPGNASGSVRLVGGTDAAFTASGTVLLADFGAVGSAPSAAGISFSGTVPEFLHVDGYAGTPNVAIGIVRA